MSNFNFKVVQSKVFSKISKITVFCQIFCQKNQKNSIFWLWVLVLLMTGLRLWRLNFPQEFYFDEIYHVPAAQLMMENDERAYEWWHQAVKSVGGYYAHDWLHPPLFKLLQAGSMKIFGLKSWAWRLPSVMAAALLTFATYWLIKNVWLMIGRSSLLAVGRKKKDLQQQAEKIAWLSSFLLSLNGLVFVQSRIAMNDIAVTLFIVLALGSYVQFVKEFLLTRKSKIKLKKIKKWLFWTGVFFGLGLATKWSAIFLWLPLLASNLGLVMRKKSRQKNKHLLLFSLVVLLILPLVIYVLSYSQMFLQGKNLKHFFQLHRQIIWYQTNRDSLHAYDSGPVQWLFNLRPVWYWQGSQLQPEQTANIYLLDNIGLSWLALPSLLLTAATVVTVFQQAVKPKKNKKKLKIFVVWLLMLGSYALLFLPWWLAPRIGFCYHYLPAIPLLMFFIAYFLLWLRSMSVWSFRFLLVIMILSFMVFYPHWIGLTVSKTWADAIYFSLSSWK